MRRFWLWAVIGAATYGVATIGITWPLFRHPGTTVLDTPSLYGPASVLIQRDINLTLWVLAWGARALVVDPLHLFHANAFYPTPWSLALSEHMLGNQPLFAPVYWATANPVLGHELTLLATFVLAGLGMGAYIRYWTPDGVAALVGGLIYALAPFRLWQLGSLHVVSIQYLPLVALAIDATLDRRGGTRAPAGLALALLLSSLCSYYVGYAAFVLAGVYALAGVAARGRAAVARLVPVMSALMIAAGVVGLVSIPYVRLQDAGVLPDYHREQFNSLAFFAMLKVGLGGLLRFYVWPLREGIPQFLTWTALALAVFALVRRRGHPRGALVAVALTGVVLSLGPFIYTPWKSELPLPYRWLAAFVPGFSAMRVPQRFGALVTLAVAALAGLGLASLRAAIAARGHRVVAGLAAVLIAAAFLVETHPRGLEARHIPVGRATPLAYRWLAAHGEGGPLLELPTNLIDLERESRYLYGSTAHWLPLVNGYTPYPPRSFLEIMTVAARLPRPDALEAILTRVPVRWVLLHIEDVPLRFRQIWVEALAPRLRRVGRFQTDLLYEVRSPDAALSPHEPTDYTGP